jgi:hypothetical protein
MLASLGSCAPIVRILDGTWRALLQHAITILVPLAENRIGLSHVLEWLVSVDEVAEVVTKLVDDLSVPSLGQFFIGVAGIQDTITALIHRGYRLDTVYFPPVFIQPALVHDAITTFVCIYPKELAFIIAQVIEARLHGAVAVIIDVPLRQQVDACPVVFIA